ncbi:Ribosomal-protein-alanine acetyltransferase [Pseudidiomarina piscicola]|uniref:[Ribosomal protein bS18]-alanine N-acetyltransferase n=1 Tax=Pseudidiomarina piscicola TaxID=2614830 RepID=A0A6S6WVY2_9GAMM|nr:ribosomal protein S18-alanine N-acetyltransferase [Pseudidiomarina piscicola]CAB0151995.1 Ribosomal-protein-alanine acetyltransferase [Pseudidiomarina piscicola]VZT41433.1 Ribosomal-protein-alanine acetyltransferase [Pseudomonas aeruginosa]
MIKLLHSYHTELYRIETSSHAGPWSEALLQDCFGDGYEVYGWLDQQQKLLAFYIIQRVLDEITLMNIAVMPEAQGAGIGRHLLEHLQATASTENATLWLEVRASNERALKLYQLNGFAEVGRRRGYYARGAEREDAVIMRWSGKP